MKKYLILILLAGGLVINIYAENMIDNPELLYTMPLNKDGPLSQKITLKRRISNINDLVAVLNNLSAINATIKTKSQDNVQAFNLDLSDATIQNLLNISSKKLGYSWQFKDNTINFYAIHPVRNITEVISNSVWKIDPNDKTLRNTLTRWCKATGWQLVWNVNADYPIVTSWQISGSFEKAVNQVLAASQSTNIPLLATMHDQNHVLEIYSDHSSN